MARSFYAKPKTVIYLLHFERPISERHTTQHYTGSCLETRLNARLAEHRVGGGARLTQVAHERGIAFELARMWEGTRDTEQQIKRWHNGKRLCPICQKRGIYRETPDDEDAPF